MKDQIKKKIRDRIDEEVYGKNFSFLEQMSKHTKMDLIKIDNYLKDLRKKDKEGFDKAYKTYKSKIDESGFEFIALK